MTNRSIGIFFGHQFRSQTQSQTEIRNVVSKSVKAATKDWNARERIKISAHFRQLDIRSGDNLFTEILRAIDESNICIFDLTDKNHNVIFELGHANGRRKEIIWICHECLPLESLPSDFQGKFVVRYESAEDLAPTLEAEILRKMGAVIQGITEERTFREIWDFGESNCVDLVFGHIPKDERSRFASTSDPNFLRYQAIADVDTLVYLSRFLSRNFPALAQQDFMPFEFRKDIDAPLIAVGGPALNKIASRYYEGPEGCGVTTRLPIAFAQDNATEEDYIRLRDKEGNVTELRSQVSSDGVTYDVGVFARFIDRQNKVPVFVISGIRTGGVLGAAKALSDNAHGRRNCQYLGTLDRDLTEFLVILKVLCRVQDGEMIVETPTLDGDSIILLDSLT